jgi:hypothetical protein
MTNDASSSFSSSLTATTDDDKEEATFGVTVELEGVTGEIAVTLAEEGGGEDISIHPLDISINLRIFSDETINPNRGK